MQALVKQNKPINLTAAEVYEITGKKRPTAQMRALNHMRIPAKLRPDNVVIVAREAYLIAMGAEHTQPESTQAYEPNFGTL